MKININSKEWDTKIVYDLPRATYLFSFNNYSNNKLSVKHLSVWHTGCASLEKWLGIK